MGSFDVGGDNWVEGVTTPISDNAYIKQQVISHITIERLPKKLLLAYIPYNEVLRVKTIFNILLCVWVLERPTQSTLYTEMGYDRATVKRILAYLLKLGYIRTFGKPRLIKPFQKYKIDTGYAITPLGVNVIGKIIGSR